MTMRRLLLTCLLACVAVASPVAQGALNEGQGHPLKGSWIGDWGPDRTHRTPVLIEMEWDGKVVTATMNPGPDSLRFTKAELDHTTWSVHLEGMSSGTKIVADGKIENLGSARRSVVGTWIQGNQKGDFKLTRQ
jgi:hypothetical protein